MGGDTAGSGRTYEAGLVIIGDEILSGRTKDANLPYLAEWLNERGVALAEVRVVPDVTERIIEAVNALRARLDYVFTTGGIGPTHDDITADSIAAAFGVGISVHPEAFARLEAHYKPGEFTPARQRMARIPNGASLIDNPVSTAPGFRLENVIVMAGIPVVMQAMLDSISHQITGGAPMVSRTVTIDVPESAFSAELGEVDANFPQVKIGSYPFYNGGRPGVQVVLRCADTDPLEAAVTAVTTAADKRTLSYTTG